MLKKFTTSFFLTCLLFLSVFNPVWTQSDPNTGTAGELLTEINQEVGGGERFQNSRGFLGELLSRFLPYAITFAGMILTVYIVLGGYQLLTNPNNPQMQEAGKNKITWAVVGFLVVFSAFWMIQIVEIVFDINVTGQQTHQNSQGRIQHPSGCFIQNTCTHCLSGETCNPSSSSSHVFCCP